jgi:hypothetical protein
LNAIPLALMPKTFEDAVVIARILGVRYLWIDSLCIIQDDRADLDRELVEIGLIYECTYLTIAASDAPDSKSGCFYKRVYPASLTHAVRLPFSTPKTTRAVSIDSTYPAGDFSVNIQ